MESAAKEAGAVNDSRRFPWLSGLLATLTIAAWLIYEAMAGVLDVINAGLDTAQI